MELKEAEAPSGRDLRLGPNKAIKHWKNVPKNKSQKGFRFVFLSALTPGICG